VQHHYEGHWKGWALKIKTFLGPEMARAKLGGWVTGKPLTFYLQCRERIKQFLLMNMNFRPEKEGESGMKTSDLNRPSGSDIVTIRLELHQVFCRAARTRLFRLINLQNGALRAPPPIAAHEMGIQKYFEKKWIVLARSE
jgi:hypothetical protein